MLVANLPYNVAVPVLLHLLAALPTLQRGLVMVQAEVAERMCAGPGSRVYGTPSVKLAWYAAARPAGPVPRTVFWPVPNVDSRLVAFTRRDPPVTDGEPRGGIRGHRRGVQAAPQDAAGRAVRLGRFGAGGRTAAPGGGHRSGRAGGIARRRRVRAAGGGAPRRTAYDLTIVTGVTVRVPAKLNLQLAVGPPRADGYHDLVTVFHAVSLFDEVTAEPAGRDGVTVTGEGADRVPADRDNLALRAVAVLRKAMPGPVAGRGASTRAGTAGVHITIAKRIPVAAGLAGGSADAAAALVACNELWDGGLSQSRLVEVAARVGSDVAFALLGGTAVGRGRGERLTPALAPATQYHWVLAFADGHLSTPEVYAALDRLRAADAGAAGARPRPRPPQPNLDAALMSALRSGEARLVGRALSNDLQPAALSLFPALRKTLAAGLELGALGALVAGSGPTCVFLAASADRALDLAVSLSGAGVCRSVARVTGPVPGAAILPRRSDSSVVNLISLEKAAKAYAHRSLLDGVSLGVSAGDRIGVVGRNGAESPRCSGCWPGGSRRTPAGWPWRPACASATCRRPTSWPERSARSYSAPWAALRAALRAAWPVAGSAAEPDGSRAPWEADPRARAIMADLVPGIGVEAQAGQLSGGERRRVALAALLVAERDVLLLDEPTNHLDIEAIDWLGRHLRDRGSAVIVVSHDRWLLDTVCERTWEVDRGQVHSAEGGYSAYVLAQAERERGEEAAERRRRNLARKELAWLQRGAKARTTKAKFRVEAANALIASEPPPRDSVELTRLATARLGKTVIELEDVSAVGRRVRRPRAFAPRRGELAARPGGPGWDRRGQRQRQNLAADGASRRRASRGRAGRAAGSPGRDCTRTERSSGARPCGWPTYPRSSPSSTRTCGSARR